MPRTILVHLNIETDETASVDEIASYIDNALNVVMLDHLPIPNMTVAVALAEEI